jgi:hypothetical protein
MTEKLNEYLLVNLDKCFLDGSWEKVKQPKSLKKYDQHIVQTPFSYNKTYKIIKKIGFVSGYEEKNVDGTWGVVLLTPVEEDKKLPKIRIEILQKKGVYKK